MRKAKSYTIITEPGKPDIERDAFSCRHCNMIVRPPRRPRNPKPGEDLGGYCPQCHANICGKCSDDMGRTLKCVPLERRIIAMESRDRFIRAVTG